MKPYKISLNSTTFLRFLTHKGVKWGIGDDYNGIIVYLLCDSELLQLGMDYANYKTKRTIE